MVPQLSGVRYLAKPLALAKLRAYSLAGQTSPSPHTPLLVGLKQTSGSPLRILTAVPS